MTGKKPGPLAGHACRVAPIAQSPSRLRPGLAAAFVALAGAFASQAEEPAARSGLPELAQVESAVARVVESVAPSVVSIRAYRRLAFVPDGAAVESESSAAQTVIINGTGIIAREDGAILTNEHVVGGADLIEVVLHTGERLRAELLAADVRSDLAIIRIHRAGLVPAVLGRGEQAARGQWAIVLGNPYGLSNDGRLSVSVGTISNLDRRLPGLGETDDRLYNDMIQTTAAICPGSSGGPLFNSRGEVVGIITAMHTRSAGEDGVGFAIPLSPGRRQMIERLLRGEAPARGSLGLIVRDRAGDAGADERGKGVRIDEVEAGGLAARAGLRGGDRVLSLDGAELRNAAQLAEKIELLAPGATVTLVVRREGKNLLKRVEVESRDRQPSGKDSRSFTRGGAANHGR